MYALDTKYTITTGSPAENEGQYSRDTIQIGFNVNVGPWGSSGWWSAKVAPPG